MSGLVLRLCECHVGLLVKAANNIFSIHRSLFARPETSPDLTRKHSGGTKQNKRKNEKKKQVKAKNKNLLL